MKNYPSHNLTPNTIINVKKERNVKSRKKMMTVGLPGHPDCQRSAPRMGRSYRLLNWSHIATDMKHSLLEMPSSLIFL